MLTKLRLQSQSLLILVLFGLLIFVFIFFFGPQSQGLTGGSAPVLAGTAAVVEGVKIPTQQVEMAVRRLNDVDNDAMPKMRREAVLQVVEQELLAQRARAAGMAASDDELSAYIVSKDNPDWPLFQNRDGKFDLQRYELYVTQFFGMTSAGYREAKERELLAIRYIEFLEQQVKVSESSIKEAFTEANTSWTLEYVLIDPATAAADVPEATVEEGQAHAAANGAAVEKFYADNKAEFVHDKEVRVRRVLLKVAPDATEAQVAELRARLEKLRAEVAEQPETMEAVARANSQDYFAQLGGDMGWQSKENSQEEDFNVYGVLAAGQISAVQRTPLGLWFVKAEEVKPAVKKSVDEVRDEIGQRLLTQDRRQAAARAAAEGLIARVKAGATLADAVPKTAGGEDEDAPRPLYEVASTAPIRADRSVWDRFPGLGKVPALARALPGLTAESPLLTSPVELEGGRVAVIRLVTRVDADPSKLGDERAELVRRLRMQRMMQIFGDWRSPLLGPVAQRELFRKFAGGALLASLPTTRPGGPVKIDEKLYPDVAGSPLTLR